MPFCSNPAPPFCMLVALAAAVLTPGAAAPAAAESPQLLGSFLLERTPNPAANQQSFTGLAARHRGGQRTTRGAVPGTVTVHAGTPLGAGGYGGVELKSYSENTQYLELNRFGGKGGGVVAFDFELADWFRKHPAATERRFTLDLDYFKRRADERALPRLYVGVDRGPDAPADRTDLTTLAPGRVADHLDGNPAYAVAGELPAGVAGGVARFDVTDAVRSAAAGDGFVRIVYLDRGFRGSLGVRNASGLTVRDDASAAGEPG